MTMADELPRTKPTSVRLSELDFEHVRALQARLGRRSLTEVISLSLTHLLASLELDARIYVTVPSEQDQPTTGK